MKSYWGTQLGIEIGEKWEKRFGAEKENQIGRNPRVEME